MSEPERTTEVIARPDFAQEVHTGVVWAELEKAQLQRPQLKAAMRRRMVRIALAASEGASAPLCRALVYLLQRAGFERSPFGICRFSGPGNVYELLREAQAIPNVSTLAELADWAESHPSLDWGCAEAMAALLFHSDFAPALLLWEKEREGIGP